MFCKAQRMFVALGLAVLFVWLGGNVGFAKTTKEPKGAERGNQTSAPQTEKPSEAVDELVEGDKSGSSQETVLDSDGMDRDGMESEDFSEATGPSARVAKVSKGPSVVRLPRYFAGIVDQEQRSQIQEIQLQFRSQIADLEEELKSIRQRELEAMEKVLTVSQKKLLDKKRQQSRVSRTAGNQSNAGNQSSVERKSKTATSGEPKANSDVEATSDAGDLKEHPDPTAKKDSTVQ